ncbi:MAG: filamentous hemagglutinin N-terminal domain-containing protein [Candidatus Tectomicrobia bacterium]|nr:filamentous hemagglutinin N-terminal domain-containing protein [Candidatus Tectomicrobia bacterium]
MTTGNDTWWWMPRGWRCVLTVLLSSGLWLSLLGASGWAQIATDGTVGRATELRGPHYEISDELGRRRGRNLFHSFLRFNVHEGQSATFTGPTTVENIVSRVTGGEGSSINGNLGSSIPGVSLFLLNPHGVMFGPHASLSLGGSFHVSTADELRFADGSVMSAHLGGDTSFSVASPAAFGFVRAPPAPITVDRSNLRVGAGQTLSIVGGEITAAGGSLQAPGGTLALVSLAASGAVPVGEPVQEMALDTIEAFGNINLSDEAQMSTSGNGGGTIVIRGGQLTVDQAVVTADNTSNLDSPGVGVDIEVAGDMTVTNGAFIRSGALRSGRAGDIRVRANRMTISDNASIVSLNVSRGESGDIVIEAADLVSVSDQDSDGLQTGILSFGGGQNEPNEVRVETSRLEMSGGVIGTPDTDLVQGRAGGVVIDADQLIMRHGAVIDSRSIAGARGGMIRIRAENVWLSGNSQITTNAIAADGGAIEIDAEVVRVQDSSITSTVEGSAETQGGNVTISPESVVVVLERSRIEAEADAGQGGIIRIEGFLLSDPDSVVSADSDRGTDGTIVIRAAVNALDSVTPLPQNFAQTTIVLSKPCAEQLRGGQVSSLVQTGRDGVPADPSGGLPSLMVGVMPGSDGRSERRRGEDEGAPARRSASDRPELGPSQSVLMLDCPKTQPDRAAARGMP